MRISDEAEKQCETPRGVEGDCLYTTTFAPFAEVFKRFRLFRVEHLTAGRAHQHVGTLKSTSNPSSPSSSGVLGL